jgi:hypothetical protein
LTNLRVFGFVIFLYIFFIYIYKYNNFNVWSEKALRARQSLSAQPCASGVK